MESHVEIEEETTPHVSSATTPPSNASTPSVYPQVEIEEESGGDESEGSEASWNEATGQWMLSQGWIDRTPKPCSIPFPDSEGC